MASVAVPQPPLPPEDGYGSSAGDSPSLLCFDMAALNLLPDTAPDLLPVFAKCSSDSGASSGDGFEGQEMMLVPEHHRQLPGPWFFEEIGTTSSGLSSSPTDFDSDFLSLRAALSSRNVTESVEVPSSEHVAEIVGRQGCKIKALRAKTSTYIKTPVRGEEPVFVVTGRPEDVLEARREIECAAEHFTQIRASRRHSQGGVPAPGHVTAYVRVPLRVVGLVVGPKGATIKRIQQDTHTYIITPSREREPIFEVTGLPQNVEAARREIEQHIYQRTGNMPITDPTASIASYDLQLAGSSSRSSLSSYGALARRSSLIDTTTSSALFTEFQRNGNEVLFTRSGISKQYSVDDQYPTWSQCYSSLGISADHFAPTQTEQRTGSDSPPEGNLYTSDPYHLMMSSIWSDLENPRDPPMVMASSPLASA